MRLLRAAAGFAQKDYARLRREAVEAARCCEMGGELGARQHYDAVARHARRHVRVMENLVAAGPLPDKVQRGHERLLALVEQAGAALEVRDDRAFCRAARAIAELAGEHERDERALLDVARGFQAPHRG